MDPDALLARMLETANRIIAGHNNEDRDYTPVELAEDVLALDEWRRKGGFLPSRWLPVPPAPVLVLSDTFALAYEKKLTELRAALMGALAEIKSHNGEYQHVTSKERLAAWWKLVEL